MILVVDFIFLGGLTFFFFYKFFLKLIYLFMAVLGLRLCARAFSSCGKWGPLLIAVRGPLTVLASPVAEHRLQTRRLSSCDSRAQPLRGMWDPPGSGHEPVSPALAGGFPTTAPPGKPGLTLLITYCTISEKTWSVFKVILIYISLFQTLGYQCVLKLRIFWILDGTCTNFKNCLFFFFF